MTAGRDTQPTPRTAVPFDIEQTLADYNGAVAIGHRLRVLDQGDAVAGRPDEGVLPHHGMPVGRDDLPGRLVGARSPSLSGIDADGRTTLTQPSPQ